MEMLQELQISVFEWHKKYIDIYLCICMSLKLHHLQPVASRVTACIEWRVSGAYNSWQKDFHEMSTHFKTAVTPNITK